MKELIKIASAVLLIFSPHIWAQDAQFIWAEDDSNGSRILLSQHKNGVWQPAEKIVDDNKLNILPTIGSDQKGHKLAVWSMVDGSNSVLKYSIKHGTRWSTPRVLADEMSTNLAPTVVFDSNDVCWVFWSANNNDDDDIYVSKFAAGVWSQAKMVNADNDVPDILPEAGLDDNGNIWVSWQQLQENEYVEVTKSYERLSRKVMSSRNAVSMKQIKQMKLHSEARNPLKPPSFFKGRSRATMHFPNDHSRPLRSVIGNLNQ